MKKTSNTFKHKTLVIFIIVLISLALIIFN